MKRVTLFPRHYGKFSDYATCEWSMWAVLDIQYLALDLIFLLLAQIFLNSLVKQLSSPHFKRIVPSVKIPKELRLLTDYMVSNEGKPGSKNLIRATTHFKFPHIVKDFQKELDFGIHCFRY